MVSGSPASERIVHRCREVAGDCADERVWVGSLLLALLNEGSLAAAALRKLCVDEQFLTSGALGPEATDRLTTASDAAGTPAPSLRETQITMEVSDPELFTRVTGRAAALARKHTPDGVVTSGELLMALAEVSPVMRRLLDVRGITTEDVARVLDLSDQPETLAVPPEEELLFGIAAPRPVMDAWQLPHHIGSTSVGPAGEQDQLNSHGSLRPIRRVLDACLNRAREGLRVLEDCCRFILDDAPAMRRLKSLRHTLTSAGHLLAGSGGPDPSGLLHARNTPADVGTGVTLPEEQQRSSVAAVVCANCRRVQEALRSLEEFGKLVSSDFAERMKQERYEMYDIEQLLLRTCLPEALPSDPAGTAAMPARRLAESRICVLITEQRCRLPWQQHVLACLDGGADVLQLREKQLPDRELVRRSRWLAAACREAGVLSIVNDRPDIARVVQADGVHVGQDELGGPDAREIVGPHRLVGISTHSPDQALCAVADGADYLGVGPVFDSSTKQFSNLAGLDYVRHASGHVAIPWFAIGGITLDNMDRVVAAGAARVALTAVVGETEHPQDVLREVRRRLLAVPPGNSGSDA